MPQKYPVTRRALKQRCNRALRKQGRVLRSHGGNGPDAKRLYVASETSGRLLEVDVDLAELGRRLGVLASYEQLADE